MTEPREVIPADENARFEGYAKELRAMQEARKKNDFMPRALHEKTHAGLVAELKVNGGHAGLFEKPATYACYVRMSNGLPRTLPDTVHDVRGFALKVVGVGGKKVIPGLEDKLTQDFLLIQTPALAVKDPDEFFTVVRARKLGPLKLLLALARAHGLGRALSVARAAGKMKKVDSMATGVFHTGAPIKWGHTAAKLRLMPSTADASRGTGRNGIRDDVTARLREGPLTFTLQAQLFTDEKQTPIEDASVDWRGPFVDIATLTIPKQDTTSTRGQEIEKLVDTLSFDPWHALEAHRPLGAMMRARGPAYRESILARSAASEPETVLSLA